MDLTPSITTGRRRGSSRTADWMRAMSKIIVTRTQAAVTVPCAGHPNSSTGDLSTLANATNLCNRLQGVTSSAVSSPGRVAEPQPLGRATSRVVTVEEAAKLLGVSRQTVYRWETARKMPARVEAGRRARWHLVDIQTKAKELDVVAASESV